MKAPAPPLESRREQSSLLPDEEPVDPCRELREELARERTARLKAEESRQQAIADLGWYHRHQEQRVQPAESPFGQFLLSEDSIGFSREELLVMQEVFVDCPVVLQPGEAQEVLRIATRELYEVVDFDLEREVIEYLGVQRIKDSVSSETLEFLRTEWAEEGLFD